MMDAAREEAIRSAARKTLRLKVAPKAAPKPAPRPGQATGKAPRRASRRGVRGFAWEGEPATVADARARLRRAMVAAMRPGDKKAQRPRLVTSCDECHSIGMRPDAFSSVDDNCRYCGGGPVRVRFYASTKNAQSFIKRYRKQHKRIDRKGKRA